MLRQRGDHVGRPRPPHQPGGPPVRDPGLTARGRPSPLVVSFPAVPSTGSWARPSRPWPRLPQPASAPSVPAARPTTTSWARSHACSLSQGLCHVQDARSSRIEDVRTSGWCVRRGWPSCRGRSQARSVAPQLVEAQRRSARLARASAPTAAATCICRSSAAVSSVDTGVEHCRVGRVCPNRTGVVRLLRAV